MTAEICKKRVKTIYLAGTPYDAFLLQQAGFRRMLSECSEAPIFELIRSGNEVINACKKQQADLIIADYALSDMTAFELGTALKNNQIDTPLMVVTSRSDLGGILANTPGRQNAHGVFIWYGDSEVLRALVRLYEDDCNAEMMLHEQKALAILIVEDEPNFYSHYLPMLYKQLRMAALEMIPEDERPRCPWSSVKSRPLVLLRQSYEEACTIIDKYSSQLIALITDLQFPKNKALSPTAGLDLLSRARAYEPHLPVVVQSRQSEIKPTVDEADAYFLWKDSPHLFGELKEFLYTFCGFGPFVFRWPDTTEWGRANTIEGLRYLIENAPDAVFKHHASHHDFSAWLGVHGHIEFAAQIRRIRSTGIEGRKMLLEMLDDQNIVK